MEAASKFLVLVSMFILMNLVESFCPVLAGEKNAGLGLTEPALCLKV